MGAKFLSVFSAVILCSTALFANKFIGETIDEGLDVAYTYYQNEWIMGLSDGSSWKLLPIKEKRKQTWTEWWNNTEPKEWQLADEFFFDPLNWKGKYTVQVQVALDSIATDYNYILVNENNNQKVFAKFVPYGSDFIPKTEYAMKIAESAEPVSSSVLSAYPFLEDILVLNDKSIWKLYLSNENMRSFSEWWNGVEIDQPDKEFVSKLGDWKNSDRIEVYHAEFNDKNLNKKYKVSKPVKDIFLLENKTRQKMAFASEVTFNDLLEHLERYSVNQYDKGLSKGFSDGYHRGYKDGQSKGFTDGYQTGKNDAQLDKKEVRGSKG